MRWPPSNQVALRSIAFGIRKRLLNDTRDANAPKLVVGSCGGHVSTAPRRCFPRCSTSGCRSAAIDFCILYPSLGLTLPHVIEDAEARQVACRADNTFYAEACRKYSDRLTPAAIVPMASPTEALEALEHAVEQLGLGVVMLQGYVTRPVEAYGAYPPPVSARLRWIDVFGMARRARFYRGGDQSPRKPRRTVWQARRGAYCGKKPQRELGTEQTNQPTEHTIVV